MLAETRVDLTAVIQF